MDVVLHRAAKLKLLFSKKIVHLIDCCLPQQFVKINLQYCSPGNKEIEKKKNVRLDHMSVARELIPNLMPLSRRGAKLRQPRYHTVTLLP